MGKQEDIYKKVAAAGLSPIAKQAELLGGTFTILELRLETFRKEGEEDRDYYIATVQLNGKQGLFYLAGVAVMDKLKVLAGLKGGMPSDWTLVKVKSAKGQRYDLLEPVAPGPGEAFDAEMAGEGA